MFETKRYESYIFRYAVNRCNTKQQQAITFKILPVVEQNITEYIAITEVAKIPYRTE